VAGLVFCKGVCTFISGNSGMRLYLKEDDVELRVSGSIRKNLENVSLDIEGGGASLGTTLVSLFDGVR